jgi:hypothetical protein
LRLALINLRPGYKYFKKILSEITNKRSEKYSKDRDLDLQRDTQARFLSGNIHSLIKLIFKLSLTELWNPQGFYDAGIHDHHPYGMNGH